MIVRLWCRRVAMMRDRSFIDYVFRSMPHMTKSAAIKVHAFFVGYIFFCKIAFGDTICNKEYARERNNQNNPANQALPAKQYTTTTKTLQKASDSCFPNDIAFVQHPMNQSHPFTYHNLHKRILFYNPAFTIPYILPLYHASHALTRQDSIQGEDRVTSTMETLVFAKVNL